MTLDRADGSVTIELYRAVLGPVHTDYYLKAFTRFDAAGKSGPSWNWSAALLNLNWMVYYRLWNAALAYVGAAVAALLFLLGILPLMVTLPQPALWALLGLVVLLCVAVPGAFGNAWLYAACTKAMERTYSASTTQEEACAQLQKIAPSRQRLVGLAGINLALCAAVGALVLVWPGSDTLPLNSSRMEQARTQPISAGLATTAIAAADAASAPASTAVASAAASEVDTVAKRVSQGPVQVAVPQTVPASAVATASSVAAVAAVPVVPAVPAVVTSAPQLAKAAKAAKPAAAPASATAKEKPTPSVGPDKYLVNVGLFADANNARNAYTKLTDAGLPAVSQEFSTSKGQRTRVRVGPFESRAEADAAAEKIRALKLDALVFKP